MLTDISFRRNDVTRAFFAVICDCVFLCLCQCKIPLPFSGDAIFRFLDIIVHCCIGHTKMLSGLSIGHLPFSHRCYCFFKLMLVICCNVIVEHSYYLNACACAVMKGNIHLYTKTGAPEKLMCVCANSCHLC